MPSLVQHASARATISIPSSSTITGSVSATFGSNNTASNSILVAVSTQPGNAGMTCGFTSITDSRGNTYGATLLAYMGGGFRNEGMAIYAASGISAGANTVTFQSPCFNPNAVFTQTSDLLIFIAEVNDGPISAHASGFSNSASGAISITLMDLGGTNITSTIGTGSGLSFTSVAVSDIVQPDFESWMAVFSGVAATFPPATSVSPALFTYGSPIETQSPNFAVWWSAGIPVASIQPLVTVTVN